MSFPRSSHAIRLIALLALALSMVSISGPIGAKESSELTAPDPGPGDADPALYEPVLAGDREDVYAATAGRLTRYRIDATLTPAGDQPATIAGTLDLSYYNNTGEPQDTLYFRLYPNDGEYAEGALVLGEVEVGGTRVTPDLSVADTLAEVRLPEEVVPEATIDLLVPFTTTIPTEPERSYGMFGFDIDTGTYALAHWEPLLAGFDPASGWNLDSPSEFGDPVFTDVALYEVTLTAPADLTLITTGTETNAEPGPAGQTRHQFVTGPVRDFVMAIDDDLASVSDVVGGTTVRSWYKAGDAAQGEKVLRYGVQALEVYGRLFGTYPYEEMDIVEVDLRGAGGIEFPQITFIESGHYELDRRSSRRGADALEIDVAHEIAHQWWYGTVGNNQYQHAFIDEGLTSFVTTIYFREVYNPEKAQEQLDRDLKLWYLTMLYAGDGDQIVDQPTDDFPALGDYGATVYGKGALGFDALHDALGDDAFFAGLTAYAADFRFKTAAPADLRAAFERASGQDLTDLWRHWFDETNGEQDFDPVEYVHLVETYFP